MWQILYISGGAILGANLRFFVGVWSARLWGVAFPWGTLLVNVAGCLLIGLFFGIGAQRGNVSPELRLFFVVGFLGAFTTFSSFGWESIGLLRSGDLLLSLLYIAGSNLLGLAAVAAGLALARALL
jgi:CrcB protein